MRQKQVNGGVEDRDIPTEARRRRRSREEKERCARFRRREGVNEEAWRY